MKATLHVHAEAEANIRDIFRHIAKDHLAAARRFLDSAWNDFECLAERPGMGVMREFDHPRAAGMRSWPVGRFRN